MKIFITLDYEIYFGAVPGSVEKCIIEPASQLMRISEEQNVRFVFFVDCGFILKLDEYRKKYPVLEKDYNSLVEQIRNLGHSGHDVQLHIHPHWEDSYYDGQKWVINVKRYKLSDFSEAEIEDIFFRYKKVLADLVPGKIFVYRAGGWCIQPFEKIRNAMVKNEIRIDSSVFPGGYYQSEQYNYDFRNAPAKSSYRFENNPVEEVSNGYFTEVPISGIKNSPLFFWKLFLLGRLNPYLHKPLGDGVAMAAPGYRKKLLTSFTRNYVSIDGYNASLMNHALNLMKDKSNKNMVVLGHPKALSRYSLQKLEEFIESNKSQHHFTTFQAEYGHQS